MNMKNLTDTTNNGRERKPLRERVSAYDARLPGHLFDHKWIKEIGACTYPLLGVLAITRDWETNIWRGNEPELAEVLGISERQVRNQLRRLKKIDAIEIRRFPYSIEIHIADRLLPRQDAPRTRARRTQQAMDDLRRNFSAGR